VLVALLACPGLLRVHAEEIPEMPVERYFTEGEARDRVFGEGLEWRDTILAIDSAARRELFDQTGLQETEKGVRLVYTLDDSGRVVGAYRIASEVGKFLPFEFLVGLDDDLRVKDVVVLIYRESHGADVRRARVLDQYRGKSAESPVRLNRDIIAISGATLSSWAVNRGVKKTLWWARKAWPNQGAGT